MPEFRRACLGQAVFLCGELTLSSAVIQHFTYTVPRHVHRRNTQSKWEFGRDVRLSRSDVTAWVISGQGECRGSRMGMRLVAGGSLWLLFTPIACG